MASLAQRFREGTQAVVGQVTSHRILIYSLFSFAAVSAAIANALRNYSNFYSVAIYLSKSSRSVLVLANFGFLVALLAAHVVQKIFFGALRPSEIERLYDRLWFFITESLLAFTIFRDEFDIAFVVMFGFLLFVKSFHWIAGDRIEWMDQRPYPGPSLLFHVRMTSLFLVLWTTDVLLFMIAVDSTMTNGIGGMVLFASEYGILMATVANTIAKYLLSAYELRRAGARGGENAPPWENKSMWVFYIELATDFLKLSTYMIFFTIIMTYYGIPLNILRDVYVTGRSLITRLRSLHRYQTATRNMDQRYPNATEEEMAAMSDHTCIICREEMVLPRPAEDAVPVPEGPNTTPKKLPCGHIFHFNCLRSWLERQQSCPTCRRNVLEARPQPAPPQAQGPAANLPGQQDPNANNAALMDRLFAPAAPGQVQPGQVQFPPNVNIVQNPPNGAGQGGLLVQYHIQYQVPRPPNQPLQPVPPFPGFAGPAGAWQPWPHNDQAPAEQDTQPRPTPPSEAPQPTPTSDVPQPIPTSSEAPPSDTSGPTPREAAALAALRRLNKPTQSRSSVPQSATATPPTTSETSTQSGPSAPVTPPTTSEMNRLPALIPIYDSNASASSSRSANAQAWTRGGRAVDPRYPQRPYLSQLPPSLTDEQLAVMDGLTREAIDERLRVLEGVSGAVNRCIDDLMRMRSVFPAQMPVQPPPSTERDPPPDAV